MRRSAFTTWKTHEAGLRLSNLQRNAGRVGFDFDFGTSRTLSGAAAANFADTCGKDVFQVRTATRLESCWVALGCSEFAPYTGLLNRPRQCCHPLKPNAIGIYFMEYHMLYHLYASLCTPRQWPV